MTAKHTLLRIQNRAFAKTVNAAASQRGRHPEDVFYTNHPHQHTHYILTDTKYFDALGFHLLPYNEDTRTPFSSL
jgi:hypothetical protein